MSCTLSHECRVMLIAELLTASTDATRGWLRAEMDRTVDPMLDSIFNRLKTKLTNVQIHQPSTSSHINPQFVNMNFSYQQQQQNVPNHLNSNSKQQLSQSQPMTIKEESEAMPTHQVQSCSYAPGSNEQLNFTYQNRNKGQDENSQINLQDTEKQPQPIQIAHIKHNQFDDEECDCDECVDGGIEVKEEDEDHVDEESSRPVKRPKMDTTQPNNAIHIMEKDDCEHEDGVQTIFDDQTMNTQFEPSQSTDTDHGQHNSDESMAIQQEEMDANNAIGDASSTECTTNPIHLNLAKSNGHFQCSHCQKSFERKHDFTRHFRVHTGERPFHCDLCDKRFNLKGNLTKHQLIHQNIKRFRCDQCDKRFTLKGNLDSHLLIHSGEQTFPCRHCAKSFTALSTRNKHEQSIHLHVKPFRCKQCGLSVTHRSDVIKHIRMVHFGLPKSIKQQRALNIIDDRDPTELVEKV